MTMHSGDLGEKGVVGGNAADYPFLKELTVCHSWRYGQDRSERSEESRTHNSKL